jgi:hypothetical protein
MASSTQPGRHGCCRLSRAVAEARCWLARREPLGQGGQRSLEILVRIGSKQFDCDLLSTEAVAV